MKLHEKKNDDGAIVQFISARVNFKANNNLPISTICELLLGKIHGNTADICRWSHLHPADVSAIRPSAIH